VRVPVSWLREYVDTTATVEEIARRLSISSLELEQVERVGVPDDDGNLAQLVVGHVLAAEAHPNADRLQLCRVDVGRSDPQQIVCGAWNFGVGATVAVGLPGAHLPGLPGPLEERPLRGQVSQGMILAEDEVGLGPDHDGIMLLPEGIEPGTPLADVLPVVDQVLHVIPTMNRPDLLSMVGIAR
jgi:phenylalanyl-tRNA synthetase beta chain